MSCDLLSKWLMHYDPVHRGWTPAGIAHAVCATNGFFFPRIRGGYLLRRVKEATPAPIDEIVGSAGADGEMIRTFPWVDHEADASYTYRLTAINGGGCESQTDTATTVGFDASGAWAGGRPNTPADLRVEPLAEGRFRVAWTYNEAGQSAAPVRFHLYHDAGTGTIDYDTVIDTVPYLPGRFHYRFNSEPFDHGRRVRWAVRAVNENGLEDHNTHLATGTASANAPSAKPITHVRCEDVTS